MSQFQISGFVPGFLLNILKLFEDKQSLRTFTVTCVDLSELT